MSNTFVYVKAPAPLIWVPAIVIRREDDSLNDANNDAKTVVEFQSNSANEDSPYYEGKQVRAVVRIVVVVRVVVVRGVVRAVEQ